MNFIDNSITNLRLEMITERKCLKFPNSPTILETIFFDNLVTREDFLLTLQIAFNSICFSTSGNYKVDLRWLDTVSTTFQDLQLHESL